MRYLNSKMFNPSLDDPIYDKWKAKSSKIMSSLLHSMLSDWSMILNFLHGKGDLGCSILDIFKNGEYMQYRFMN